LAANAAKLAWMAVDKYGIHELASDKAVYPKFSVIGSLRLPSE
jgi:hypothetical protein